MVRKLECAARPLPWLALALALGLGLRCYHYLSNPAVWHDEAALLVNVLGKGFADLLGPLFYSEAAPPLFLWLQRAVALGLGDGTFALRLLPFLASGAAFLAAVTLARRLLSPWGVVWFALLFGCSDRLLWHACEAKPYAVDVLVAVGLLATFVFRRADDEGALLRRLTLYAALSPLLVFLSFPACFLLGGAALALLPAVLRARSRRVWGAYVLFGVLLCGSFVLLVAGPVHAQKNEHMLNCWLDNFPDWGRPWRLPLVSVVRLTELFRYASEPAGNVLSVFAVAGAVGMWRAGHGRVLAFLLLPLGLTALAWLAHQYPFGAARVDVFAAPAALLLIAAGLPPTFRWLGGRAWPAAVPRDSTRAELTQARSASEGNASPRSRFGLVSTLVACSIAALVLFPVLQAVYRVAVPWKRLDSAAPAAFVLRQRQPSEPVLGMLWEHTYYFRGLGPMYRALQLHPTDPPSLPPTASAGVPRDAGGRPRAVTSLWLVCLRPAENHDWLLSMLPPTEGWSVAQRYPFADMVVLRLVRAGQVVAAPDRPGVPGRKRLDGAP
jgi:hypothetical protein